MAFALAVAAVLLSATGTIYALINRIQLLFYPSLSILFGSITYAGARVAGQIDYDTALDLLPRSRVLDTAVSVAIVAVVLLSRTTAVGLGAPFYWSLPIVVLLFVARVLQRPSRVTLVQLFLFAVAVRAAIWFSAPTVGVDTRVHLALTQLVINSGSLPSPEVTYYHWYPLAHIAAGVVSQLSTVSPKQAVFLTQGMYACVSLLVVYLFTMWILEETLDAENRARAAMFAVLVIAVAPWHLRRTSVLIAQSMALATVPFALYTSLRFRERKYAVLAICFSALIVFTHNLTPLVLTFILVTLLAVHHLVRFLRRWELRYHSFDVGYKLTYVFSIGLSMALYWLQIQYFDLQVYRLFYLLIAQGNVNESASESSNSDINAFSLADPFFHVAIEQLVFGTVLLLLGCVILEGRKGPASDDSRMVSEEKPLPAALFLAASAVFVVLSVSLLIGWDVNVVRALPNIVLVIGPTFGFLFAKSYQLQSLTTVAVVALLLLLPASSGVALTVGTVNQGLSPTESVSNEHYLTESDLAGTDFVLQRRAQSAAYFGAGYVASTANYRHAGQQTEIISSPEATTRNPLMNVERLVWHLTYTDEDSRARALSELREGSSRYFLQSSRFEPSLDPLPRSCSTVYDVGDTKLVAC